MSLPLLLVGILLHTSPPQLTADVFGAGALAECKTDLVHLNQVTGWQARWPRDWARIARSKRVLDQDERRWRQVPAALARAQVALRRSLGTSRMAPRVVVARVHQQVRDLATEIRRRSPRYFGDDRSWNSMMSDTILPALEGFGTFLGKEYLARAPTTPGLARVPDGPRCFRAAVEWWTSVDVDPEVVEAQGRRLLAETEAALRATAPERSKEELLDALRKPVPSVDAKALLEISRTALARASRRSTKAFRHVPSPPEVVAMEAHLQDGFPAGYYRGGSAPAFVVNPSRPGERRRMAEVIAFHEGVPGHHLFFAYPGPNRGGFQAGILEGWAIYAEYLADELGLYTETADRQGMMAKHLWAASRLVVEPGLHVRGWSRQRAVDFMLEVTALPEKEVTLEVDRYIAMPGQSLAYMLGYLAIAEARQRAERALGAGFDLADFHHAVLAPGARPLAVMEADVDAWVDEQRPSP